MPWLVKIALEDRDVLVGESDITARVRHEPSEDVQTVEPRIRVRHRQEALEVVVIARG